MDKSEFLKQQFITLRDEIKETKSRIFKLVGYGIVVVPGAHFLAKAYNLDLLLVPIPILVIVVALLYLAESHALMRAGTYIKFHIEPEVKEVVGWEEWLECPSESKRRSVDNYVGYCFYLLFLVYYTGSVFMASKFVIDKFGTIACSLILGFYIAIGIWFMIYLVNQHNISTATSSQDK